MNRTPTFGDLTPPYTLAITLVTLRASSSFDLTNPTRNSRRALRDAPRISSLDLILLVYSSRLFFVVFRCRFHIGSCRRSRTSIRRSSNRHCGRGAITLTENGRIVTHVSSPKFRCPVTQIIHRIVDELVIRYPASTKSTTTRTRH